MSQDQLDPGYLHDLPDHERRRHPLSGLFTALSRSAERLEAWHDRASFTGVLSPEEIEQDRVLGEEVWQDLQDEVKAIDAAIKAGMP